ncbi:ATP-dependent helicase [Methylibium sp.]|uniref:ATP-dependent helicase n=1 Tax=Methylibium sp. TaxID=2067992 RepID=UPI003D138DA0
MNTESTPLDAALRNLSQAQRVAAEWKDGALLVLAGPGSGKTQVLTCRIGSLLEQGRNASFRVLALTFTNKAADEMKERVTTLVPGLEERALISTFHSFCGQVLRQHGVHAGIASDFAIYSLEEDRRATLKDAIRRSQREGVEVDDDDGKALAIIDRLKSRLIAPDRAEAAMAKLSNGKQIALLYRAYEDELKRNNALDFNSLIFEAYRLFDTYPAVAARYRRSYPYWLIDEFQDTNDAQYKLLGRMAGDSFRNVFAVADDDQIIYQWNGASFRQIQRLRADLQAQVLQLPTNYRCPPAIVDAANRLVQHNLQRTEAKAPLIAGKSSFLLPSDEQIEVRVFDDANAEAEGIAQDVAVRGRDYWKGVAVLARTRALLEAVHLALTAHGVPAVLSQRRDDFLSPAMRLLVACMRQVCRPLDKRNVAGLVESFNRLAGAAIDADEVLSDAEATGLSYGAAWLSHAEQCGPATPATTYLLGVAREILADVGHARSIVETAVDGLVDAMPKSDEGSADLREDVAVWKLIGRDISRHIGHGAPLDQFLQELQLRSKEPPVPSSAVTLMTVHASKGREFDTVYLIGLAEDQLPSYQSRQKGDDSPEMEEERRNCFVAITRAKERLILSRALRYRGWAKAPSRFLEEMGVA